MIRNLIFHTLKGKPRLLTGRRLREHTIDVADVSNLETTISTFNKNKYCLKFYKRERDINSEYYNFTVKFKYDNIHDMNNDYTTILWKQDKLKNYSDKLRDAILNSPDDTTSCYNKNATEHIVP